MPLKKGEPVIVVEYDASWPRVFTQLCSVLQKHLGNLALSIEHVGSTSVPDLPAKPIIDLSIVIESRAELPQVIRVLETLGYRHQGDKGVSGREAFARADANVPYDNPPKEWMDHHLYVCAKDNEQLRQQVAFRDYLRGNREAAQEYANLKKHLAEHFKHDRIGYTEGKTEFVTGILKQISHSSHNEAKPTQKSPHQHQ